MKISPFYLLKQSCINCFIISYVGLIVLNLLGCQGTQQQLPITYGVRAPWNGALVVTRTYTHSLYLLLHMELF